MCNLSIWKEWSPAVAYTLGFAFADGTVTPSKNTLVIYQKDKGILERISAEIPADSLVYSAGSKVWRLRYTAKGLVEVLSRHGVVRNKTKLGYWPPSLPSDMEHHYIRGFFDGDGNVLLRISSPDSKGRVYGKSSQVGFVCHLETYLRNMQKVLASWGVSKGSIFNDKGNWRLRYSSCKDIAIIADRMYSDDGGLCILSKKDVCIQIAQKYKRSPWHESRPDGKRKLTESQVAEIRARRSSGETIASIASDYPINFQMVSRICRREAYQ